MCVKIVTHERRDYNLNTHIFQLTWTKLLQYFKQLISTIYFTSMYHLSQRFIVFNYNVINFTVDILIIRDFSPIFSNRNLSRSDGNALYITVIDKHLIGFEIFDGIMVFYVLVSVWELRKRDSTDYIQEFHAVGGFRANRGSSSSSRTRLGIIMSKEKRRRGEERRERVEMDARHDRSRYSR